MLLLPAWYCLDYATRMENDSVALEDTGLTWATDRLHAEALRRADRLPFNVSAREGDESRISATERAGIVR